LLNQVERGGRESEGGGREGGREGRRGEEKINNNLRINKMCLLGKVGEMTSAIPYLVMLKEPLLSEVQVPKEDKIKNETTEKIGEEDGGR
jgi:hypothetical protein